MHIDQLTEANSELSRAESKALYILGEWLGRFNSAGTTATINAFHLIHTRVGNMAFLGKRIWRWHRIEDDILDSGPTDFKKILNTKILPAQTKGLPLWSFSNKPEITLRVRDDIHDFSSDGLLVRTIAKPQNVWFSMRDLKQAARRGGPFAARLREVLISVRRYHYQNEIILDGRYPIKLERAELIEGEYR